MIPIANKPYPDELLYSWIFHMAEDNGLRFTIFAKNFLPVEKHKAGNISVDAREEFPALFQNLYPGQFGTMKELYLQLTTYQFESMVMTPGKQIAYINNVFRPFDRLNPPKHCLFTTIKICPECLKEDTERYGRPYIHRSHQLSGVCTCHKHKTKLLQFKGKRHHELLFDSDDYEEIPSDISLESMQAYTAYAQALFEAHIDTNAYHIRDNMFSKIHELGYDRSDYIPFVNDFEKWQHADLSTVSDFAHFFKLVLPPANHIHIEQVLPILMFLFPDVNELVDELHGSGPVLEMYVCPVCGKEYCSTPKAEAEGWGCPYCSSSIPEKDRFEHMVESIGHGEYRLLEDFQSLNKKVKILHEKCGGELEIKPRNFLFLDQRCSCESILEFDRARELVEAHEGFKLISIRDDISFLTVYNEKCGHTFQCRLANFLQHPRCKVCEHLNKKKEVFEQKMAELVGDEYTLVGDYLNTSTNVKIRHNACGCIQEYTPADFLDGYRCKLCSGRYKFAEYQQLLEQSSGGRYTILERRGQNYVIQDTKTKQTISLSSLKMLQEIQRPTPSPFLPALEKNTDTENSTVPATWDKKCQLLAQYKNEFGTAEISMDVIYHDYPLGQWCAWQRSEYRQGTLSEREVEKLNALGFVWDPYEMQWNRTYDLCVSYLAESGKDRILRFTEYKGVKIGAWIASQKRRNKLGKLSDERKQKLLQLYPDVLDERRHTNSDK